jgi:hypothetical protein
MIAFVIRSVASLFPFDGDQITPALLHPWTGYLPVRHPFLSPAFQPQGNLRAQCSLPRSDKPGNHFQGEAAEL